MDDDERPRSQSGGLPERTSAPQVTEEVTAKENLLRNACLREETEDEPTPSGIERNQRLPCVREDGDHKQEQEAERCGCEEPTESREAESKRAGRSREGSLEEKPLHAECSRDDEQADQEAGLAAITSKRGRGPLERSKDNDQAGKELRPLDARRSIWLDQKTSYP